MIMVVISSLIPIQTENHTLKKILLFYWEIIEKVNKDGSLKDEMILVCNSLRNDLLHPNEFIRGKTLKHISRIMYKGVLEPLTSAIIENLEHKHTYVRRNAIVALYNIFLNFGDDLIPDIDEYMEKILLNESDLSTKRNAFLLLFQVQQQKAMEYLNKLIVDDQAEDMGDIMQLAVLELFRKTCKYDPSQRSRLMKAIFFFSKSESPSIQFECANTLTQISNTPTTLRMATNIYLQLLLNISDNNVKIVVLDKLSDILVINPKFLEDQVVDITKIMGNPSADIRKKSIMLIKNLVSSKNIDQVFPIIVKEIKKVVNQPEQQDFLSILLDTNKYLSQKFPQLK